MVEYKEPTERDIVLYQAQVISQSLATISQSLALINTLIQREQHIEEASDEQPPTLKTDVSVCDHKVTSLRPDFLKIYE
jgi:hypothetical protein